jgi:rubrerythrin
MPKPRNLTAAAYDEKIANPPAAHIKDSVSNTAPGLEFDERSIDKYVFPGFVLEFQRQNQDNSQSLPIVRTLDQDRTISVDGSGGIVTFPVDQAEDYLFVYALRSVGGSSSQTYRFYSFRNGNRGSSRALDCWNAIRNMPCEENTKIALLVGVGDLRRGRHWKSALRAFNKGAPKHATKQQFPERTSTNDPLVWAVVVQRRAPLEDYANGLIFPNVPPGDLQSTMCTPWHYDLRDCHCYYWASNRPDMVSTEGPEERNVHFLRKRRAVWERTPIPPNIWAANPDHGDRELHRQREVLWNHVQMINDWETLPVVLDDTEAFWPYRKVVSKLEVLAGIEHALAVEYLYAYHSVDPNFRLNGQPLGEQAREVVLKIATDEMRHFRWVNQILELLNDRRTVIDRAENYGPNFDWRACELRPLDQSTLDWFIRIEKPSKHEHTDEKLQGLYISVEKTIVEEYNEKTAAGLPSAFGDDATVQKILSLIKLIMEEGEGHYRQLADLKVRLFGRQNGLLHLRRRAQKAASSGIGLARSISDTAYQTLLFALGRMFAAGGHGDGSQVQRLVDHMQVMSTLNERLAELGHAAVFQKPVISATTSDWDRWREHLKNLIDEQKKQLAKISINRKLRQAAGAALKSATDTCLRL